jgi:hypothetical protein
MSRAVQQSLFLGVGISLVLAIAAIVLTPSPNLATVTLALRASSATTAAPFLTVFLAQGLRRWPQGQAWGDALHGYRRPLWLVLTFSHLVHLAQIGVYYQLGQSCPLFVWAVTTPLWLITVWFAVVELTHPQRLEPLHSTPARLLHSYQWGCWYVWLIFFLAFALSVFAQENLPYTLPGALLFAIAGLLHGWPRRQMSTDGELGVVQK